MGLKQVELLTQVDYSGGLNAATNPLAVEDNQSTDCRNVHTNIFKSVEKRKGRSKLNSTAISGTPTFFALFDYGITDTNRVLTAIAGDTLYKMDALDGTWDSRTMTVAIGTGRAELYRYVTKEVIVSQISGNIQSWNGTDAATVTISGAAAFKYGWVDENVGRMFFSGLVGSEGVAFFTPVNTLSIDTTNDKIQVSNISDVLGGFILKGKNYAMASNGIYRIDDLGGKPRFGVKFVTGPGTRSPLSAKNVNILGLGDGVIYLDVNRRLQFFNGFETVEISLRFNIRSSVSPAQTLDQINSSELANVHAVVYGKRNWYMLFYPAGSDTVHKNVMVYDLHAKSAWPFTGMVGSAAAIVTDSLKANRLFAGQDVGIAFELDVGNNDDGTNIVSNYEFNRKSPKKGFVNKFRQVNLTVKVTGAFTVTIKGRTDFNSGYLTLHNLDLSGEGDLLGTTFILGTSILGSVEAKISPVSIDLVGNYVQLRIEDTSSNPAWQLFGDDVAIRRLQVN